MIIRPKPAGEVGALFVTELFESDEHFWLDFKKFNALYPGWNWSSPAAQKSHTDLFGDSIDVGDVYFSKAYGVGWHEKIKLSRASMEKIMYVAMVTCPIVEQVAEQRAKKMDDEIQAGAALLETRKPES